MLGFFLDLLDTGQRAVETSVEVQSEQVVRQISLR